jgi:hypothetical protein
MLVVSLCMGWIVQLVCASFAWRTHLATHHLLILSSFQQAYCQEATVTNCQ